LENKFTFQYSGVAGFMRRSFICGGTEAKKVDDFAGKRSGGA